MPQLKWSGFNVIFPADFPDLRRRICHEEETVLDGADRRSVEVGRAGIACSRSDPSARHIRDDLSSMGKSNMLALSLIRFGS